MEKHYKKIFFTIIMIKLFFAGVFPITTDEAYWLILGKYTDVNYYDHPPMSGWIIYLFSLLGNHVFFSRLFTILYGAVVGGCIYFIGNKIIKDKEKAKLASLAFLAAPLHVLFVLIATDTSLCLFVFLSGIVFYFGNTQNKSSLIFFSGIFLGLAVLSKYFSGLLLIAFIVCLFVSKTKKKAIQDSVILVLGAIPFVLIHLYWNSMNCWTNIMFNVINRNQDIKTDYTGLFSFLAFQIYLTTPWLLFYLMKNYKQVKEGVARDRNIFFILFIIPMLIFGIISIHHTGLHWYLSFFPFLFFLLVYFKKEDLKKIVKYSAFFSLVHLMLIATILSLPTEIFKSMKYYKTILIYCHGDEIYKEIKRKYEDNYILGGNSYSTASVMTYHGDDEFIVFSSGSKYGRHYDKLNDFRLFDGKNILIFSTNDDYQDYFDSVTMETITVRGQRFNVILGHGFRYQKYRDRFLKWIGEKWYNIPDFLPLGDCFLYNNYFPEATR